MNVRDTETTRNRILEIAEAELFTVGYRGLKVDTVAALAGISKKTLYQAFPSKRELALEAIRRFYTGLDAKIESIFQKYENPLDCLKESLACFVTELSSMRKPFLEDIRISLPEAWIELEAFRENRIKRFVDLIMKGKKAGLVKKFVNPGLLTQTWLGILRNVVTPENIMKNNRSISEVFEHTFRILFEGIFEPDISGNIPNKKTKSAFAKELK